MPLEETIETFGYLLREVNKLGLSYVTLVRYSAGQDPEFDGLLFPIHFPLFIANVFLGVHRATKHDVVATFGPLLTKTPVFVNSEVTPTEAEELVSSGTAAGVFFGFNILTHPDLGKRIKAGKPFDNVPDVHHLYGAVGVDPAIGYVDYPEAVY
jgi:2,4-dienoyl-CoA reductase-like NADH-dependent reductase (Old Yellow Enzyme family)